MQSLVDFGLQKSRDFEKHSDIKNIHLLMKLWSLYIT